MSNQSTWKEQYLNSHGIMKNGSPAEEEVFFSTMARQIREVVNHFKEDNKGRPERANHARGLAGFTNAIFRILPADQFPRDLSFGLFAPGSEHKTILRFSNASGELGSDDSKPDLRGVAMRIESDGDIHDFLMTNAEIHHGKDAKEAMIAIRAGVRKDIIADIIPDFLPGEETISGLTGALPFLIKNLGVLTAMKIAGTLKAQMKLKVESLATESYWSRAPLAIGNLEGVEKGIALKYRLRPEKAKSEQANIIGEKDLGRELMNRLDVADVRYIFEIQRYKNPEETPIEDATISWGGEESFVPLAELIIPRGSKNDLDVVNRLQFNPWNLPKQDFRPLSSMNRCRKIVYEAGVDERTKGKSMA